MNKISVFLKALFLRMPIIKQIIDEVMAAGGRALLVGGAVRDVLLNRVPKDIDIELYGLKIDEIQKILKKFGNVSLVGKSFGVLRLNGLDVDWSVPRRDSSGRKPQVELDPDMSYEDAFRRRDLTVNAMGIDLITGELIDPYGGFKDLKEGRLHATDKNLFIEDPLRLFRVMQFIGRFEMNPDDELNEICKTMDISKISHERVEQEFNKLFLRSRRPSLGIDWLRKIGRLKEVLPEVYSLVEVKQGVKWHPEGDVYIHTLQVLDAAAAIARAHILDKDDRLMFMWAALCHDLGKPLTSKEWEDGRISAHKHEVEGVPFAKKLMKRFSRNENLIESVAKLVKYHMQPGQFITSGAKEPAYKRLAYKLAPEVTLELLSQLACADKLGRNPLSHEPLAVKNGTFEAEEVKKFCSNELAFQKKALELNVLRHVEGPVLLGRDLVGLVEPGPKMGKLLKKAYDIQIDEGIVDKDELKKRIFS